MYTNNSTQSQPYLELLFANRNKAYGAYELRKHYAKRFFLAISTTTFLALSTLLIGKYFQQWQDDVPVQPLVKDIVLESLPVPEQEQEKPAAPTKPSSQKLFERQFVTPTIVRNSEFDEADTVPTIDDLAVATIGGANTDGDTVLGNIVVTPGDGSGNGGGSTDGDGDEPANNFTAVEQGASFPGGAAAWARYLERNLNNNIPIDNNAPEGTYKIVLSFWVDTTGAISEVAALNSPGFGIEAEAKRVIAKGPKWLPALQNGKKVAHRQQQSITFLVQEN
ncbi:MAG: hypothetical protein EAZ47_08045 [Bacteroidetes bacterium]|nr:MAG: hypothetical protein EAY72_07905 [Bacteroidota bacterium]TAF92902.1 MAG: hypothetical protein EAZ47_08045 [Bacteroidota bacterium]